MSSAGGDAHDGAARCALSGAALAVAFLTVVPVRPRTHSGGLAAAAAWLPAVGALVGLAAGAVRIAAEPALGPGVAAVLAAIALVVVTGGLHQDGLADCADALGVRGGRERRLAVMRDSTVGAFGVLALVLWAALLVTTLAALPREEVVWALVLACATGRWAAVLHAAALPPARRDGLGAAFAPSRAAAAVATGSVAVLAALHEPLAALAAAAAGLATTLVVSAWARRGLGGRTGDTLGAAVALAELIACAVLLGFARA